MIALIFFSIDCPQCSSKSTSVHDDIAHNTPLNRYQHILCDVGHLEQTWRGLCGDRQASTEGCLSFLQAPGAGPPGEPHVSQRWTSYPPSEPTQEKEAPALTPHDPSSHPSPPPQRSPCLLLEVDYGSGKGDGLTMLGPLLPTPCPC